jgi:hypothetical protein
VCSPDREDQLFPSLGTLLSSGTSFDRVAIFSVGPRPAHWRFSDPRIVVKEVAPVMKGYFLPNKIYLCRRMAPRVVFLDTDTFILRPLDILWQGKDTDFLGRPDALYTLPAWSHKVWNETLQRVGAANNVPMFNTGVMIFQNHSQRRIETAWSSFMSSYLKGEMPIAFSGDIRLAEQLGLALAVGTNNLRFSLLERTDHAFGWRDESYSDAVVFHTANQPFVEFVNVLGRDHPPLPLHDASKRIGASIQPSAESDKTIAILTERVRRLRQEVVRYKNSRAFAIGNLVVSNLNLIRGVLRLNKRICVRSWKEMRESIGHLWRWSGRL